MCRSDYINDLVCFNDSTDNDQNNKLILIIQDASKMIF